LRGNGSNFRIYSGYNNFDFTYYNGGCLS